MRLYFTGAQAYQAAQPQPEAALGGYPSSSLVPNDALEAVFGSVSPYARQNLQQQVRCLALLNETPAPVGQLRLTLEEHPELAALLGADGQALLELEVGLALPNVDVNGNPYFEQIPEGSAAPYYASFGADVQLATPLQPGHYVAVWLRLKPTRRPAPTGSSHLPVPLSPSPDYFPHLLRFNWS